MLRAPSEADRDTWIALHRDPRTYTHAPHAMAASDEVASVQFDKVLAHWDREGYGYHLVEEQGQVVGCGGLKRNDDPAELNLYYRLVFGAAGQGLAREAARAWVAWGLEWLPTLPIVAAAAEHNAASVATARTCGLVPTSRRLLPGDPPEFGAAVILTAPRVDVVRTEGFDPVTLAQVLDLWVATTVAGERWASCRATLASGMPRPWRTTRQTWWPATSRPCCCGRPTPTESWRSASGSGRRTRCSTTGGTGLGWVECGRLVGGIRVGPGDDRDDIWMMRRF